MADLLINGADAFAKYGVRMGNGFIDTLGNPLTMKEYPENESRIEHGKRILTKYRRFEAREFSLEFTIQGKSPADYKAKKKAFLDLLYGEDIRIQVPSDSDDVYHLTYKGTSQTYGRSKSGMFCKMNLRFEEPNPANRGD